MLKYANSERRIAALPILARPKTLAPLMGPTLDWLLPAIGVLIWTVRRSGIFPTQLNDPELIRGSLGINFQNCKKRILWYFDTADLFHAFFTGFLFFEQFFLTRNVASIALGSHILAQGLDIGTGHDV